MATSPDRLTPLVLRTVFLIGVVVILYFGKTLLLPIAFAGLLAMTLNPLDDKLRSWGLSRMLSITGVMMLLMLFFAIIFMAVGHQGNQFAQNWPKIEKRISAQANEVRDKLGLPTKNIAAQDSSGQSSSLIGTLGQRGTGEASTTGEIVSAMPGGGSGLLNFVGSTLGVFGDFLLMLVYVVLLLSQKERLREFAIRRMSDGKRKNVRETIRESVGIVQDYLRGRLILMGILSVSYSIGFTISGLDYAILIAIFIAVLSIIPYIGNIIGGIIALALAFAGGGESQTLYGIMITMTAAQLLENYVLTPIIVGDEVDLNSLATIVCVVGMTILWGPVGAIIAIPLFAIIKIICQHVEGLDDYAYLLGQD